MLPETLEEYLHVDALRPLPLAVEGSGVSVRTVADDHFYHRPGDRFNPQHDQSICTYPYISIHSILWIYTCTHTVCIYAYIYMAQRRWFPPPRPGMVYGSYPPPPPVVVEGGSITYLLLLLLTYLVTYLVCYLLTVAPRSPLWWWKGAHLLSYLLNCLVTYLLAYLLTY